MRIPNTACVGLRPLPASINVNYKAPCCGPVTSLKATSQLFHHRSLTASVIAMFFAFLAMGVFPMEQNSQHLFATGVIAVLGLMVCMLTLLVLLHDGGTGYPSFRCSVATLLWSLSCVPIVWLTVMLVSRALEMR
jgi:hypothetical protein